MSKNIVALNIGSSTLTLAEFTVDKKVRLDDYAVVPLNMEPGDSNRSAYVNSALEDAKDQLGVGEGPILLAVPSRNVLARYVKLPPVSDAKKEREMVQFEAEQIIPFPLDEVVWDYQTLGDADGMDDLETLIIAIKSDQIDDLTADLKDAELKPSVVDVAPIALFNNFAHNYPDMDGCTLVIDVGAGSTDLIFIEEGQFFTRNVGVAGNSITQQIAKELDIDFLPAENLKQEKGFVSMPGYEDPEDEEAKIASKCARTVMTRLHGEINRAINLYKGQQSGSAPERVFLTGGASIMPYLDEFLADKLGVEVEHMHTFADVKLGKNLNADQVAQDSVHLGEVIGLAVREMGNSPVNISLMSREQQKADEAKKRMGWIFGALAVLLGALGLWTAYHYFASQKVGKRVAEFESVQKVRGDHAKKMNASLEEIAVWQKKVDQLQQAERHRDVNLRALSGLYAALPDGVWLHEVKPIVGTMPEPEAEVDPDGEKPDAPAAPAAPAAPPGFGLPGGLAGDGPQGVIRLSLTGLAYTDIVKDPAQMNDILKRLLRATDPKTGERLFEDKPGGVVKTPRPNSKSEIRSFLIEPVLRHPIPLETEALVTPL